ncbi:MAG TPA: shikimate kinase [Pyrinomonadaceae bacterium]|jgi:shikimate kinase|nr:shikimate kinase [Pyrinomonadaceae bacterium]
MAQTVVITGFMGCGKSKIARALARSLDLTMVDLDDSITARTGRTPAQLINEDGERAFRRIESDALREVLRSGAAGVIALGGGAWIEAENRELINQYRCASVWLDVPFEVCWSRIESGGEDRPLGKTRSEAEALFQRRRPVYQLANFHITVQDYEDLDDLISRLKSVASS